VRVERKGIPEGNAEEGKTGKDRKKGDFMQPVPYRIREADVDEVISAYEPVGGGAWSEEARQNARAHVMRNVLEVDEVVRTALEDERATQDVYARVQSVDEGAQLDEPVRREVALAAIEDLLIRDGFLTLDEQEGRVFPAVTNQDDDRNDF
jgi:hypothetical protein